MKSVEEALRDVKEELLKDPLVEEYFRLKNIIENDENLENKVIKVLRSV